MPEGKTIVAGSANNNGNLKITVTPYSTSSCAPAYETSTLKGFWGAIPKYTAGASTNDGNKIEPFGDESQFRMATVTSAEGQYDSTKAVNDATMITSIPTTTYTNLVQAVCQHGKLVHPKNADVQYDGTKPYSGITNDAVFIRKFQPSDTNKLTISAKNIGKAKAVYWYDGKNYLPINVKVTGVYDVSTDKIIVTWDSNRHEPITTNGRTAMIIIVMGTDSPAIETLTLS
jgi:hypothetical protein